MLHQEREAYRLDNAENWPTTTAAVFAVDLQKVLLLPRMLSAAE